MLTNMAGDVAVKQIEKNVTADNVAAVVTAENIDYAAKQCTKENAEKAYDGYKWADKKADELGIDKQEVARKAGNAALAGGKLAWEGLKKVDYNKLGKDLSSLWGTATEQPKK